MKTELKVLEKDIEFYMSAETAQDNVAIIKAVDSAKSPCRSYGYINETTGLAWGYVLIPRRRQIKNPLRFANFE